MISVSYVYDTVQTIIRKDQKGNSFNISEFNRIIKLVNYELFNYYVSKLEVDKDTTEALKNFMNSEESISLTSGVGDLPADYKKLLGDPYVISGSDYIDVDLIARVEKAFRFSDELTKPTATNPVAIIGGLDVSDNKQIEVWPDSISTVYIDYLSMPSTPLLDYYIASTGLYVYMDEGATGVSIPAGAVYSDGTPGPISRDSQTVDLEWGDDETPAIINMVLQKAGVILTDQMAVEYGIARETKEQQQ